MIEQQPEDSNTNLELIGMPVWYYLMICTLASVTLWWFGGGL